MKKLFLTFLLLAGSVLSLSAQDLIYRINPVDVIEARVIEVGESYVRYTRSDNRPDVTFNIPSQYIRKIVFGDGKEMVYNDVVSLENDRRNAIKLSFLSPTYGATTFSYERNLKTGQAVEFGIGIIGFGIDNWYEDASGVILKAGYKFISRPEHYQNNFRYAHLLKGSYIKPELTFVSYSATETYAGGCLVYDEETKANLLNFSIVGGKQWVFSNTLLLDLYGGLGFAVGDTEYTDGFHYGFAGDVLTWTGGFKVGFLFGSGNKKSD